MLLFILLCPWYGTDALDGQLGNLSALGQKPGKFLSYVYELGVQPHSLDDFLVTNRGHHEARKDNDVCLTKRLLLHVLFSRSRAPSICTCALLFLGSWSSTSSCLRLLAGLWKKSRSFLPVRRICLGEERVEQPPRDLDKETERCYKSRRVNDNYCHRKSFWDCCNSKNDEYFWLIAI